ncbi:hypothetical protein QJS10_CPA16g00858 [Acorus calamus]|uniref:WW domain-containing protein n=1 Tax=Acorus calamus TaxID=4465 RepID=A0AAV9CZA9_ACOCL|nr:hypothetical protein QJS10_CPA16g00858 [Acorus calamus]
MAACRAFVKRFMRGGGGGGGGGEAEEVVGDKVVDLRSDEALPYGWQQLLDIKTGEISYINRITGTRTTDDPRNPTREDRSEVINSYPNLEPPPPPEDDDDDDEDEEMYYEGLSESEASSFTSSCITREDPNPPFVDERVPLIVAGCNRCFMYHMLPRSAGECPNCGGGLVFFDRTGGVL